MKNLSQESMVGDGTIIDPVNATPLQWGASFAGSGIKAVKKEFKYNHDGFATASVDIAPVSMRDVQLGLAGAGITATEEMVQTEPEVDAKKDLEDYLNTVPEKVCRNVEIVTPADMENGYPLMLHISIDTNIKKFIPLIGRRQSRMEDRTVPRITVSPYLLGCMIGYASINNDFFNMVSDSKEENLNYKGGYAIYGFEYEACLKPNNKMVYDASMSDEHWLVSYNRTTNEYKPIKIGKTFIRTIEMVGRTGKLPNGFMSLYIEITYHTGLWFSKNHFLKPGFYRIEGPVPNNTQSFKTDKEFTVTPIDSGEFYTAKNASASMLGLTDEIPSYLKW